MILDQKRISFNERSTNITDVTPVSGCNEVSSLCIVNPPSKIPTSSILMSKKIYKYHQ